MNISQSVFVNDSLLVDGQQSIISKDTRRLVEAICLAGLTPLVCLVGIPANIINCLVFWRQGMRDRMNLCLYLLSLVDLAYLSCEFVMYSGSEFISFYDEILSEGFLSKSMVTCSGIVYGLRSTSVCINMIIAIERCMCVVFPMRVSLLMETRTMGVLIVTSLVLLEAYYLIIPFSLQAEKIATGHWLINYTPFYEDNIVLVNTFGSMFFGVVIPVSTFLIISAATIVTVIKLKAALEWRGKLSSTVSKSHNRHMAVTSMLVIVSCIYVFTMAPFVVWELFRLFIEDFASFGRFYDLFMVVNAVVHVFPRINSSLDFFVYLYRSSRYRQVLLSSIKFLRHACSPTQFLR